MANIYNVLSIVQSHRMVKIVSMCVDNLIMMVRHHTQAAASKALNKAEYITITGFRCITRGTVAAAAVDASLSQHVWGSKAVHLSGASYEQLNCGRPRFSKPNIPWSYIDIIMKHGNTICLISSCHIESLYMSRHLSCGAPTSYSNWASECSSLQILHCIRCPLYRIETVPQSSLLIKLSCFWIQSKLYMSQKAQIS